MEDPPISLPDPDATPMQLEERVRKHVDQNTEHCQLTCIRKSSMDINSHIYHFGRGAITA